MAKNQEELMKEIVLLSDKELSAQLRSLNEHIGPINRSTRKLYEKKLYKRKYGEAEETSTATDEENCNNSSKTATEFLPTEPVKQCSVFYGVQVDPDDRSESVQSCVLTDEKEFRELLKKVPRARFKKFNQESAASAFLQCDISSPKPPPIPERLPPTEASEFRSVKVQELMKLGREIELGNVNVVRETIWSNPRYLITSGDTPTILKMSARYNALHNACAKNQAAICQLLLDILENMNFYRLLYPTDSEETQRNRMEYLQDMYLNMPDKGLNESPLHFACKYGHADVVKVLATHPKCDKSFRNRDGKTPAEVICDRATNATRELYDKIQELLEDQYYVPLLRNDDSIPCVGQPWSPTVKGSLVDRSPALPFGPAIVHSSPKELLTMRACAGPMSPKQAEHFRKTWLTPPSPSPKDRRKWEEMRRGDFDKGMERVGRTLADDMKVGWKEHWEFLHSFTDLSSPNGLQQLERHLAERAGNARQREKLENDLNEVSDNLKRITLDDNQRQPVDLNVTPNYVQYLDLVEGNNQRGTRTDSFDVLQRFASLALDRSSSSESSDSYVSARSELEEEPINDLNRDSPVYLVGNEPCKTDLDVYRALVNADVSEEEFPLVHRWLLNVKNFSDVTRNQWRTPRRNTQLTPLRLAATSPADESPSFHSDSSLSEDDSGTENNFNRVKVNLMLDFAKVNNS
uniref:Ankyrin repeat and LEM domain-containing protein 2 n=1 Tax=Capitella teleta TaxID=283909 RepID=X2B040_CAPTE